MMNFDQKEKLLFVVDEDYYPLILEFKNKHPKLNIKLINRSGLIDRIGYSFKQDPLPFLIKGGIEYSKAKKTLNIIRCLNKYQGEVYQELISKLNKDYLTTDEYGLLELSRYQIYLLEMDEDNDIKSLVERLSISYQLLHLSDLEIEEFDSLHKTDIIYFSNKFAQYGHIFSDIRRKIKDDDCIKENIRILVKDEADLFYIYTIAKLFDIDVYAVDEVPIIATPAITEAVNQIYQNKSFEGLIDKEELELLNSLIKQYRLNELDDFDYAYLNLLEILSSQKQKIPHGDRGIVITKKYTFNPKYVWYVTNFEYGSFYKEYSDNNVLSDSELRELKLTTSFNKTALDERKKANFLKYSRCALLSRVKQHQSESIYDSQFMDDDLKDKVKTEDKVREVNQSGEFTSAMNLLVTAHQYDQHYYNQKNGEYRSYDHSYNGVNANSIFNTGKWSVTMIEKYIDCPFKFLYDQLIQLPSDWHHAYRGTFIHAMLEDVMHDDYDFDVAFKKAKKAYIESMEKHHEEFTKKEETWLEMYKYWLKNIISSMRRIKDHNNQINCVNDAELKIEFEIDGYKFHGIVDKIIYTQSSSEKYYTVVDYKTGAEEYDDMAVVLGKSIQLPLYYYALENFDKNHKYIDGYTFGGFLIQHPYFSTIKKAYVNSCKFSEERLLSQMRYKGINLATLEYAQSFDDTVKEGGVKQNGVFLNGKLTFTTPDDDSTLLSKPPKGLDKFNLNDVIEASKKSAVRIIEAILNNEFDIAPTQLKITEPVKNLKGLMCQYCNHRDICYVNPIKEVKDYSTYIKKVLLGKEENTNE